MCRADESVARRRDCGVSMWIKVGGSVVELLFLHS